MTLYQRCYFDLVPSVHRSAQDSGMRRFSGWSSKSNSASVVHGSRASSSFKAMSYFRPTFFSHAWSMPFVDLVIGICKSHGVDATFMRAAYQTNISALPTYHEMTENMLMEYMLNTERPPVKFQEP